MIFVRHRFHTIMIQRRNYEILVHHSHQSSSFQHISSTMVVVEPLLPCIAGVIMSLVTVANLYLFGRITGISGIISNAYITPSKDRPWRLLFLSGMLFGGWIMKISGSSYLGPYPTHYGLSALAGFLIGFGAMLANGCTSGHGLCGLPRLSIRSYTGIGGFLMCGMLTSIGRSKLMPSSITHVDTYEVPYLGELMVIPCVMIIIHAIIVRRSMIAPVGVGIEGIGSDIEKGKQGNTVAQPTQPSNPEVEPLHHLALNFVFGLLFSIGLAVGGMTDSTKVIAFLNFVDTWDTSLGFILAVSVLCNFALFRVVLSQKKPVFACKFSIPTNKVIDPRLVIGSCLFGIGWGLSGLCPGPGFVSLASGNLCPIIFTILLFVGIASEKRLEKMGLIK